jgi:subtilisin family serine protease
VWHDLDALHRISTGRRVVIAQIDTGVDLNHRALRGQWLDPQNFVAGSRFSTELHGTGVAGVIVARPDTSVGLVGVAPGARIMPMRACWQSGADGALCSSFTLARSLDYALRHGARVINLSLAGTPDLLLERLLDRALDEGIVVVAAAREDGADPGFPASHPRVIAVARGTPAAPQPHVVRAPGDDVLTTTPNDSFAFLSGASFAAAHITGLTALLLELAPNLSPSQVQSLLRDSADEARQVNPCTALTALMPEPRPVPCQAFKNASARPAATR